MKDITPSLLLVFGVVAIGFCVDRLCYQKPVPRIDAPVWQRIDLERLQLNRNN